MLGSIAVLCKTCSVLLCVLEQPIEAVVPIGLRPALEERQPACVYNLLFFVIVSRRVIFANTPPKHDISIHNPNAPAKK